MRWTISITISVLLLLAAYTAWPLVALYQLAGIVESRDQAALAARVDLPRLRRSLTEQIVAEYLKQTGRAQRMGQLGTSVAVGVGATIADPIVERLLNMETLAELLNKGAVSAIDSDASLPAVVPPLDRSALSNAWRAWLNTEYSGTRFRISLPTDKPTAQQFRVRLDLMDLQWKLTGVDLPDELRVQLARELIRSNPSSG